MANGFKGEISLKYGGDDFTMVLDFNALCDFEGETGKNALVALEGMEGKKGQKSDVSASDLRALMWAGLRQHHPDMTLALAGSILGENSDAITRASAAANKPVGKRKAPKKPRKAPQRSR